MQTWHRNKQRSQKRENIKRKKEMSGKRNGEKRKRAKQNGKKTGTSGKTNGKRRKRAKQRNERIPKKLLTQKNIGWCSLQTSSRSILPGIFCSFFLPCFNSFLVSLCRFVLGFWGLSALWRTDKITTTTTTTTKIGLVNYNFTINVVFLVVLIDIGVLVFIIWRIMAVICASRVIVGFLWNSLWC